jgi:hypothetical protein
MAKSAEQLRDESKAARAKKSAEQLRDERKAARAKAQAEQREIDMAALDALEIEHGDANVGYLEVPYEPGTPTIVVFRVAKEAELKRFRSRLKADPKAGVEAAEEVASLVRLYPDDAAYAKILEHRSGVHAQIGGCAIKLATGKEVEQGKDATG